jgi:hypothetical protein
MVTLADLWLPILLSAAAVFVVSSVLHMLLPLHRGDHGKMPGEEPILAAMRDQGVNPGQYMFPCPGSMKDMGTPEMQERYRRGPVGTLTVMPNGAPRVGRSLVQWFLFLLLVGVFVGYLATLALHAGAESMAVFRTCGTAAILAYAVGTLDNSIWRGVRWSVTLKFAFDGILYGLVTAGVFASLWPSA